MGAACLAILGGQDSLLLGVALFLLFSATESVSTPMEMTFATEQIPRDYWGRMQSLRVMGFQLPAAAGSFWAGEWIVRYGYGPTFGMGALALLANALVLLAGFGRRAEKTDH